MLTAAPSYIWFIIAVLNFTKKYLVCVMFVYSDFTSIKSLLSESLRTSKCVTDLKNDATTSMQGKMVKFTLKAE